MIVPMTSIITGKNHSREIDIAPEQYNAWKNAGDGDALRFVQNAFPHLSEDDREYLMSGITSEEWSEAFGSDDE